MPPVVHLILLISRHKQVQSEEGPSWKGLETLPVLWSHDVLALHSFLIPKTPPAVTDEQTMTTFQPTLLLSDLITPCTLFPFPGPVFLLTCGNVCRGLEHTILQTHAYVCTLLGEHDRDRDRDSQMALDEHTSLMRGLFTRWFVRFACFYLL